MSDPENGRITQAEWDQILSPLSGGDEDCYFLSNDDETKKEEDQ